MSNSVELNNVKPSKSAVLSECGTYRYELSRRWGAGSAVVFIGLNPSTADAYQDDPTIRRCVGFAKAWGHDALIMMNLFAYRATKPADMFAAAKNNANIVGPRNAEFLESAVDGPHTIIAAWGKDGDCCDADDLISTGLLKHLGLNKNGTPKHPLYLPKTSVPIEFDIQTEH